MKRGNEHAIAGKDPALEVHDYLKSIGACPEAIEWSRQFGGDFRAAWDACPMGSWLYWLRDRRLIPIDVADAWSAYMTATAPAWKQYKSVSYATAAAEATAKQTYREATAAAQAEFAAAIRASASWELVEWRLGL